MGVRNRCVLLLLGTLASGPAAADDAIQRGSYVAAAGNCISCHTTRGGKPFAGGLPLQTPLGTIHSTNITPDPDTGIGSWSLDDFRRALREGIAADGSWLFPAFPYTAYTHLSDEDIADLYAFLRSLEPVRSIPPENDLLFSLRWPLILWNALFLDQGPLVPDKAQSAQWNRGAYLVEGPGHCSACHTPRNPLLAEDKERAYQGSLVMGEVSPGVQRPWFAVNLTSAKQGLARWSAADLARYFGAGFSSKGGSFGPMNEVIVNSLRRLSPADQRAMAVYLKSRLGPEYADEPVMPAQSQEGAALYRDRCEECHAANGRGGFLKAPPVAGSAVAQGEDPASLINVILYGATEAEGVSYGAWESMPAYSAKLNDQQIAVLCNYLRGSWGNRASAVSAESVAQQR